MPLGKIVLDRKEIIELSMPVNPAYVTSARLTASSIANRMGFDIECTEDIKSAVSEACAYLIHKKAASGVTSFKILFAISERELEILLSCDKGNGLLLEGGEEYGIIMIQALMDVVELTESDDGLTILMKKTFIR